MARIKVMNRARRSWRRVYDPEFDVYFWYNVINGGSQWHLPKYQVLFTEKDEFGAHEMQRIIRGFVGRRRVKNKANSKWTRFFDSKQNKFYWMENENQRTFWNATKWLVKQEINMPPEDEQLFDQFQKIKALTDMDALWRLSQQVTQEERDDLNLLGCHRGHRIGQIVLENELKERVGDGIRSR